MYWVFGRLMRKVGVTGLAGVLLSLVACGRQPAQNPYPAEPEKTSGGQTWTLSSPQGENVGLLDRFTDFVKLNNSEELSVAEGARAPNEIWHHNDAGNLASDADYARANELLNQQRYADAKELLKEIVNRNAGSSSVWRRLGDAYYNLLELSSAISAYEKAVSLNRENYFAIRGLAFAYLYHGHDLWNARRPAEAHGEYGKSLKLLQQCMRIYPGDVEAMYGRGMAAEGASRRLYQNALALLGQGKKQEAASAARNCFGVIDEGVEVLRQRVSKANKEIGPRNVIGGLFQRRAILGSRFQYRDAALDSIDQAVRVYESILKIDPENALAKKELEKCTKMRDSLEAETAPGGEK